MPNPAITPTLTITVPEIASRALRAVGINPAPAGGGTDTGTWSTLAALATETLRKLAVIASDETPSVTDQTTAVARVIAVHDQLVALGYVNWTSDAVPDAVTEHYITMAANLLAPQFGLPAKLEAYTAAQEMIRQQALSGPLAQARAEALVQTVHDSLAAEAMVDWSIAAIPDALGEIYVQMTVVLLHPIYGKPADPQGYAAGIATVRRVVLSGPRGQALAEIKVTAVHEAMVAAGLVAWPIGAVPAAHAEDYVRMAAALLAPVMGYQQDPASRTADHAAWEAAEGNLRRAGLIRGAQARAMATVQAVQAELNALGLVTWGPDEIPAALVDAVTMLAVAQMGAQFGKPDDPKAAASAQDRVRKVALMLGAPALATEAVMAVHADLAARGATRWSVFDIPRHIEEPYVFLAANRLAPAFGEKPNPMDDMAANVALARAIALPSAGGPVIGAYF